MTKIGNRFADRRHDVNDKYSMRYNELLEGVAIRSIEELAAFAVVVAEAYDAAPRYDPSVAKSWNVLKRHTIDKLMKRVVGSGIKVEYTASDPYSDFGDDPKTMLRAMLFDIIANKRLLIYSGHSDDHPNFSADENIIFRTIHDYFTHGKLLKTMRQNIENVAPHLLHSNANPSKEELTKIIPHISLTNRGNQGHRFAFRGELNALSTHIRIAPKEAAAALFCEVAGQVGYQTVVGQFPIQKVAYLDGFDFLKLGKTIIGSHADNRKKEVLKTIERTDDEGEINVEIIGMKKIKRGELVRRVDSRE